MTSSMGLTDGKVKKATYEYNGLGHRMGQSIATGNNHPASTISYTLDLTRQYHNLLQKTTGMATVGNSANQTYYWDGNVTGMEEEGRNHFYFQDDLGSPMRLAVQERSSVLVAECASALLTFSSAHSCNPPETLSQLGDCTLHRD